PDVVAAADEPEPGAKTNDRASEEGEPRMRRRKRDRVADDDQPETKQRARPRAPTVRGATTRYLHDPVHDELHGHEEADRRAADVVRVREPRRDRAEDCNVPPDGEADADAARSIHAGERTLLRPMRRAIVFSIVLAVLAACALYEAADAAGVLKPGYGPTGSTEVEIAALVALLAGSIAL